MGGMGLCGDVCGVYPSENSQWCVFVVVNYDRERLRLIRSCIRYNKLQKPLKVFAGSWWCPVVTYGILCFPDGLISQCKGL